MKGSVTIRKASAYLTTFNAPQPANDAHEASKSLASLMDNTASACVDPPVDEDERHNSIELTAPQESELSASKVTEAEIETKITLAVDAERQAGEHRLRQAREDWKTEIADSLADRLQQAITSSINCFRDDVAVILTPFVSQEVFNQTIEELTVSIKKALAGADDPAIEISGPADVIEKLSRALADRDIAIIPRESEETDIRVHFGSTMIQTALETWLARLAASRREEQ